MASGSVIVVAAHGSRAAEANDAHRTVVDQLAGTVQGDALARVVPAFLELAEPSIDAAIDDAVLAGAEIVLVLPYFLYPGKHLTRDLPAIVEAAVGRHPAARIELLDLFGARPGLAEVLADQVRDALS
jgi:sirohydrochlorin ferrochelatase